MSISVVRQHLQDKQISPTPIKKLQINNNYSDEEKIMFIDRIIATLYDPNISISSIAVELGIEKSYLKSLKNTNLYDQRLKEVRMQKLRDFAPKIDDALNEKALSGSTDAMKLFYTLNKDIQQGNNIQLNADSINVNVLELD